MGSSNTGKASADKRFEKRFKEWADHFALAIAQEIGRQGDRFPNAQRLSDILKQMPFSRTKGI